MTVTAFILCFAGLLVSLTMLGATRMALLSFLPRRQEATCAACGRARAARGTCEHC